LIVSEREGGGWAERNGEKGNLESYDPPSPLQGLLEKAKEWEEGVEGKGWGSQTWD